MNKPPTVSIIRSAVLLSSFVALATVQAQPVIHDIYPDGAVQLQATNTLSFGATSGGPDINPSGVSVQLTALNLRSQLQVTNLTALTGLTIGGTPTERTVTAPLNNNILSYTAVIIVTDGNGGSTTNTVNFDTLSPVFTIEAEDFNYTDSGNAGLFVDNPLPDTYFTKDATEGIDAHSGNIGNGQLAFRAGGMNTEQTGDKPRSIYTTNSLNDYNVGWTDGGEWGNYTRTFPAGVYNIYMRTARGNGGNGSAALSLVTSDPTQAGQTTTTNIGTFVVPSTGNWQSYAWTPLTSAGVLQPVTLGGVQTLRFTTADGYNVNYYAFFPANTNLPSIQNVYPNGAKLFQPTNVLGFVASSTVGIDPSGINVDLYATNLIGGVSITNYTAANGLTIGGTTGNRTVTLPLQTNILFYRAVIHVTDQTANTADATVNFNTLNPAYAIEAEDFDYNNGLFHDNPQTNAYAGSAGVQGVDSYHAVNPPNGPPNGPYRTDGYNNENCGDNVRDQYDGTGFSDYNLGWNEGGFWANYTRNYPAGTYNVFMRGGNGTGGNGIATLALVTSGVGTPTQTTTNIGTFVIPQTGGWQTYTWAPLKDSGGNLAQVTGGALKTFRVTAGGGYNPNFYAFFPADTSLPTITGLYPSGTSPFQHTNTLRFTASSTAGIAQNNIVVIVDGAPVSGLTFSGSATSWNVTYPNLAVNSAHMVTIMVTANNSAVQSTTVKFDTFKSTYYQFEAEDYDYDGGSFIDNPQTNAYSGLSAVADVDFHDVATGGGYDYRPAGTATEGISDIPRDKFAAATDYNIGFFENGEWGNYTRNYPAGTYHIWARIASGNGSPTTADLSRVTDGWGTDSQSTSYLGRFLVPSDGWGNFNWVRLNNTNHNQAVVLELNGSTNTLRLSRAPGTGGANANFIMLVPVLAPITVNAAKVGGNIQISFPTQAGFSYQAQYKNSLTDVSWTNLGGAISGNNTAQSVNDSTSGANRFYRVQVTEP